VVAGVGQRGDDMPAANESQTKERKLETDNSGHRVATRFDSAEIMGEPDAIRGTLFTNGNG
jgi:hypothetical protein